MIKSSGMALHSENIYASQVALLYERQSVLGIAINLLLAALLVIAYWGLVPEFWLLGWLGGMVLLMSVRLWLTWCYRQDSQSDRDWGRLYGVLVVLTGLLWGGLAVMLIPSQTPEQRALFLLILAGLIIAALPMLAVIKSVVLGYSLAVQLPIIGLFAFSSDSQDLLLSTAVLIFLLGTTGMAWYLHQIIFDWLRLRQENRALLEESRLSRRDLLTGLPNRAYLQDKLEQAIARAKQDNGIIALLYFNIAHFHAANESLGHEGGDELLQALATRLQEQIADTSTVARMNGDEFMVLLEDIEHPEVAMTRSDSLRGQLEQPYFIDGKPYNVKFYIGISQFPQDGETAEVLLNCANQAAKWLRQEQQQGVSIYADGKPADRRDFSSQEQAVRRALENEELCLYYQPQIDLFNYSLLGFEALLRWNHPQQGVLSPDHIIPIAEEIGVIEGIGRWALGEACAQGRHWQQRGFKSLTVSVNVSARQFMQDDFVRQVEHELQATGFPPGSLKLELTESMLLPDAQHTLKTLHQLRELGVQLALDDFGTGYASLSYLTRFPLDWLKIDKSFVQEVAAKPNNAAIVTTTITLAHSLGMKVIAEGVEDESQLAFIQRHHGDGAQGYYFSRPLPQEAACDWLRQSKLPAQLSRPVANRTVLLLEDDDLQRQLYTLWLKPEKYQIITASDAGEAFAMLARQPVDVVLVDYVLPDMNGVEFLRRVRSIYPDTVRVMISASTDHTALAKAINDGSIFRFLDKPVSDELLRQTVRQAMTLQEKGNRMVALSAV